MNAQDYRERYGSKLAEFLTSEAGREAILCVETNTDLFNVLGFQRSDVKEFGPQIVAAQQGFLTYSAALSQLAMPEGEATDLGPPDYVDPLDELEEPVTRKRKK